MPDAAPSSSTAPAPTASPAGIAGGDGGRTVTARTTTGSQTQTETQPILRLRGANIPGGPRVQWAEGVVDNEGLGRKSSKVCCIYHRPHAVDESSDSDSSSSSSSSSSGSDDADDIDRRGKGEKPRTHRHKHDHGDDGGGRGGDSYGRRKKSHRGGNKRKPSPNAYEKVPKYNNSPRPSSGSRSGREGGPMTA